MKNTVKLSGYIRILHVFSIYKHDLSIAQVESKEIDIALFIFTN